MNSSSSIIFSSRLNKRQSLVSRRLAIFDESQKMQQELRLLTTILSLNSHQLCDATTYGCLRKYREMRRRRSERRRLHWAPDDVDLGDVVIAYFTDLQHAKLCSETHLRLGYILNVFLNCPKFQPQYSYKEYSYKRKLNIMVNHAREPFRQLQPKGEPTQR